MHLGDPDLRYVHLLDPVLHKPADKIQFLVRKCDQSPVSRFIHRYHNLLHIKIFFGSILLYHTDHALRLLLNLYI